MSVPASSVKRKARGLAALFQVQNLRRLVQAGFALFILYTGIVLRVVGEGGAVPAASPEAYCPLGGFETLYKVVTSGGKFVSHTHLSNVVLFGGVLVLTVAFRGAFCGWICPLGAIQEWLYGLSTWIQKRMPIVGSAVKRLKRAVNPKAELQIGQTAPPALAERLDRWLRYFRYVVLAWIVWGTITYGVMVFRDVDPWAALLGILTGELAVGLGLAVLVLLIVAGLFVERAWCRYACPLGAIIGVASKVSPVRIQREGSACSGCAICSKKCPVGIVVASAQDVTDTNCNMCLQCVDTCPKPGALDLRVVLPGVSR